MRIIFIIVFINLITIKAFGTAQRSDILIYGSDTLKIFTNPLGDSAMYMYADTVFYKKMCSSTACWRGYIGTYKIIDNKLYLVKMNDCCDKTLSVDLSIAFKDRYFNDGVLVSWFNDTIYAPIGSRLYYSHMGYESVYEKEIRLIFYNGVIIDKDTVDNSKTRLSYFGNNEKLSEFVIKNVTKGTFDKLRKEVKVYVSIVSDDKGQIIDVEIPEDFRSHYDKQIIETLMKINDWDILYRHGKRADLPWLFPVIINKSRLKKYGL